MISVVLGMAGFNVDTAANGVDALQMIRSLPGHYKLVLTDHKMPLLDGLGLVKELRTGKFPGKIIVLSGSLFDADIVAYNELGVDAIIPKPFDFDELPKTVTRFLTQEETAQ